MQTWTHFVIFTAVVRLCLMAIMQPVLPGNGPDLRQKNTIFPDGSSYHTPSATRIQTWLMYLLNLAGKVVLASMWAGLMNLCKKQRFSNLLLSNRDPAIFFLWLGPYPRSHSAFPLSWPLMSRQRYWRPHGLAGWNSEIRSGWRAWDKQISSMGSEAGLFVCFLGFHNRHTCTGKACWWVYHMVLHGEKKKKRGEGAVNGVLAIYVAAKNSRNSSACSA